MVAPRTESGYNLFDMLSMMQKAIRRGLYNEAGFAAEELKTKYRAAMWNRLLVISSEDCYGVVTKEIMALKEDNSNDAIARAVALLCRAQKSRDACYFSCNFVMASRNPRDVEPDKLVFEDIINIVRKRVKKATYDTDGFEQQSLFDNEEQETEEFNGSDEALNGAKLIKAILHRDMDMAGYYIDQLRHEYRAELWEIYKYCASEILSEGAFDEINALEAADNCVNSGKKNKDEIFISKAAMVLMYHADNEVDDIRGDGIIQLDSTIDWSKYNIRPTTECRLKGRELPEWVFDCHTLKGKKMGKTDWDMTRSEQDALHPLKGTYFDDASWIYAYEQDYQMGVENDISMIPIREFAETHAANPVEFLPYD